MREICWSGMPGVDKRYVFVTRRLMLVTEPGCKPQGASTASAKCGLYTDSLTHSFFSLLEDSKHSLQDLPLFESVLAPVALNESEGEGSESLEDADDVSWFFDGPSSESDRNSKSETKANKNGAMEELLGMVCKCLYNGITLQRQSDMCIVEQLAQRCLLLLVPAKPYQGVGSSSIERSEVIEMASSCLSRGWVREQLEILCVLGPPEDSSFVFPGMLLQVTKNLEVVAASGFLPLHDFASDLDLTCSAAFKTLRTVLLAGSLSLLTVNTMGSASGARSANDSSHDTADFKILLQRSEEASDKFKDYCKQKLQCDLKISLLLVEGSLDSTIQLELLKCGVYTVSNVGAQALYRISKISDALVISNLFSVVEDENVGEMEGCLLRSHGIPYQTGASFPVPLKRAYEPKDRDALFLALRPQTTQVKVSEIRSQRMNPIADVGLITLVICSSLGDKIDLLVNEVKKLVNKALCCLVHGFLRGGGEFEKLAMLELVQRKRPRSVLVTMVSKSFVLAFEEVFRLSFQNCGFCIQQVERASKAFAGQGQSLFGENYVHLESFRERYCGIERAIEMTLTLLATEDVLCNSTLWSSLQKPCV